MGGLRGRMSGGVCFHSNLFTLQFVFSERVHSFCLTWHFTHQQEGVCVWVSEMGREESHLNLPLIEMCLLCLNTCTLVRLHVCENSFTFCLIVIVCVCVCGRHHICILSSCNCMRRCVRVFAKVCVSCELPLAAQGWTVIIQQWGH